MSTADRPPAHIDDLTDEAELGDVLAALAEPVASTPPPALRAELLAAVARRPRTPAEALAPAEVYARRVAALAALLAELTPDEWSAPAAPYRWSVHELVAHLVVVEEYTARQLGLGDDPPAASTDPACLDHLAMGAPTVASLAAGPPSVTVARWRAAADRVVEHALGPSFVPTAPAPLHAWPFDAATALVVRAFEIWTHADDVRRATGRPLDAPAAGELRTMSSTSVRGLPALLALAGGPPLSPTRVVLTGDGGGTFDLGPAPSAEGPANLLAVDVVAYCRVVAQRVAPDELPGTRTGDEALLSALLHASQAIAV